MRRLAVCLMLVLCCSAVYASIDAYEFQNDEQRYLYQKLTEELRCPKCQNQNLADSDSQIAADLRKELYQQLLSGKSEGEIVDFMRERYGDFVLYKPRIQWNTLLLWLSPLVLVLIVLLRLVLAKPRVVTTHVDTGAAVQSASAAHKPLISARWLNVVSLLVLLGVAVGSLLIYRQMGSVRALQITDLGRAVFSQQFTGDELARQQQLLLGELDAWLTAHPTDEGFVYMRARLLSMAGEWDRAIRDYQHLVTNFPDQDNFLAEYAQTLFLKNNRELTDDARAFLHSALTLNPHNITALGLLGMYAFEQKDYRGAIEKWGRLLQTIPQGTPQAAAIAEGVEKARTLGGIPAAVASDMQLRVQVSIAPEANAKPDDVVFVLLRAKGGPRMPLAAVKTTVAALVNAVVLDTANSPMKGQMDWSAIKAVEVVARLSHSAQPMPVAGDWEGVSETLQKNALPAELRVAIARKIAD